MGYNDIIYEFVLCTFKLLDFSWLGCSYEFIVGYIFVPKCPSVLFFFLQFSKFLPTDFLYLLPQPPKYPRKCIPHQYQKRNLSNKRSYQKKKKHKITHVKYIIVWSYLHVKIQ